MESPLESVLESERLAPMLPLLYSAWLDGELGSAEPDRESGDLGVARTHRSAHRPGSGGTRESHPQGGTGTHGRLPAIATRASAGRVHGR